MATRPGEAQSCGIIQDESHYRDQIGFPLPCMRGAVILRGRSNGGRTYGGHAALDGGLPDDVPPRSVTPEYDAWMAKRAQEAARLKTQQQPK
jgi:hypothetical protein